MLLPLRFNDGREVPAEWLAEAVLEIVSRFGAASYETQKVEGHWRHGGIMYRDDLVRMVVDVPDTSENRSWVGEFKTRRESATGPVGFVGGELPDRHRVTPAQVFRPARNRARRTRSTSPGPMAACP